MSPKRIALIFGAAAILFAASGFLFLFGVSSVSVGVPFLLAATILVGLCVYFATRRSAER
jgi:hypothetical protein